MGRNALLPILLWLLIVFDGYNVCFGWERRKLLVDNPKGDNKSANSVGFLCSRFLVVKVSIFSEGDDS